MVVSFVVFPRQNPKPIHYVDRATGQIKTEKVVSERALYWLYNNPLGKLTLQALMKRKIATEFYGWLMHTHWSARKIEPFIKTYHIDTNLFQKQDYHSFNDFFIRKLKPGARKIDTALNVVVSPADGKVFAFKDIAGQSFIVKGYQFNLKSFLQNDSLAKIYRDGSLLLFRLCPTDYHRFHFPVSGELSKIIKIKGDYYSVNPIALRQRIKIFCENKREYQTINNPVFGNVIMAEIGATMVGSIVQTFHGNEAVKGAESGYFQFGGSSIILLFQPGKIKIDPDLIRNTQDHLETSIEMGEHVATRHNQ
ncbi:MAG: phosphatidylserine decarboxylase [Bacteroidales bacterium]|nr:phosphatidylserine decarboxylase [Bacteroidales bacterium]